MTVCRVVVLKDTTDQRGNWIHSMTYIFRGASICERTDRDPESRVLLREYISWAEAELSIVWNQRHAMELDVDEPAVELNEAGCRPGSWDELRQNGENNA